MPLVKSTSYRAMASSSETPEEDFYCLMLLKDLRKKINQHQKHLYRCRLIGVVSCVGQAFSLHEPFDESTKLRISLMYIREAMPYYGMSFTAQLFGYAHWRQGFGPVMYPLHVTSISPYAARQSQSSMQWVIDNHLAKQQEAADRETASELQDQQSRAMLEPVPSTSAGPSRRVEEAAGPSQLHDEPEEALSAEAYIRPMDGRCARYVRTGAPYYTAPFESSYYAIIQVAQYYITSQQPPYYTAPFNPPYYNTPEEPPYYNTPKEPPILHHSPGASIRLSRVHTPPSVHYTRNRTSVPVSPTVHLLQRLPGGWSDSEPGPQWSSEPTEHLQRQPGGWSDSGTGSQWSSDEPINCVEAKRAIRFIPLT